ncbi:MAG: 23S rRNA (uracil(1939)-C(5))-methyltransferase RlmD [Bacteroidaceae bacterium]|nr:23S rRNA (uracil(1939)-C(5))-methyltransferase RlmD [Bacteroidaceae bacterium]
MTRKKKPLPLLENILIEDVAAEGKALAHVDGLVVFAPYVVPGDVCDLQLRRKKHSYAEAEAVRIHHYSDERAEPFCPHFGVCGGCKWQCLKYDRQLHYKQKQVEAALKRIGKVEMPPLNPILGSHETQGYRNKLEFGFSNKKWLTREVIESGETVDDMNAVGFHIAGAFDKILDITDCRLMPDVNNRLRNSIRHYATQHGLTFYDIKQQKGLLRSMMLRSSDTGELMLLLQFAWTSDEEEAQAKGLLEYLKEGFPEVTSLLYVHNLKCNDTIGDLPVHTYSGTSCIYETMESLRFKVGPKSFYQTNTRQAHELYKVARRMAALTGKEVVYDLYTGTGTIALFVARQAAKVVGVEYVPEAIADAEENARLNGVSNTAFYAGDMKDILTADFIAREGRPDVIITDPPRAGMHPDVVRTLLEAAPQRIVYVSCNPATQARDLALLNTGYRVSEVQPVDMFPHTHHVENVCLLEAR